MLMTLGARYGPSHSGPACACAASYVSGAGQVISVSACQPLLASLPFAACLPRTLDHARGTVVTMRLMCRGDRSKLYSPGHLSVSLLVRLVGVHALRPRQPPCCTPSPAGPQPWVRRVDPTLCGGRSTTATRASCEPTWRRRTHGSHAGHAAGCMDRVGLPRIRALESCGDMRDAGQTAQPCRATGAGAATMLPCARTAATAAALTAPPVLASAMPEWCEVDGV